MKNKLKKLYSTQSAKISGVIGTGIHTYSQIMNNEHTQDIIEDFTNERYISGILKIAIPFILPYAVSLYAGKKSQKIAEGKINNLERTIKQLEESQK